MSQSVSKNQPVNLKKCGHTVSMSRTDVMQALLGRTGITCPKSGCGKFSKIWMASQPGTQPRAC